MGKTYRIQILSFNVTEDKKVRFVYTIFIGHGDNVVRALSDGRKNDSGFVEVVRHVRVHEKRTIRTESDQRQRNGVAID